MRYELKVTGRFKKSYKRVKQFPGFKQTRLDNVIDTLLSGEPLPEQYRDHALTGSMTGQRECHLAPDILLIYSLQNSILTLTLIDIGTHSQLFR
jgi:mRNA interferase YafQ